MEAKILLVEDDESLGTSLQQYLEGEGYVITRARSLTEARAADRSDIGCVILDWMLPDGQGIDFLKELREAGTKVPIMMLTARTELIDKVIGLESGADDYMTKPFEPRELIARIRVQMRKEAPGDAASAKEKINVGDLTMDFAQREVFFEGVKKEFTKMEFDFLRLLAETPNRAFSREEILNKVWGYENYPSTRTVDTHVLQIRQKLTDTLIETVRGIGYRLRNDA
ncbi:MAG: response regulator transcription factor [Halobacteriovoraceae bacterium]|jgi:DNA-binding response OmpR family regulator|nr:response regulator transcription factor [Halobacteriovoraceae bacterium]MBT5092680.1 response regulator transcription factor [Halobacteriovoraceae bacterium]